MCVSFKGCWDPFWIHGKVNKELYVAILDSNLKEAAELMFDGHWVFQQDGAPAHRAKMTTEWIANNGIKLLGWPACSTDFNIVENVCGMIVRDVYKDGKQYYSKEELWKAIQDAVEPTA